MARRKTWTDADIAALKPKAKRYSVPDPELPSHYVRVTPSGAKSFVAVATDPNNKQKWTTIGTTKLYTLAEAREKAKRIIKAVRDGADAGVDTFLSVAGEWLKRHVKKNGIRTRAEIERLLAKYIFPKWSGREFTSLKRSDVTELLDHIEDKHGPRQADCCLTVISSIANWYAVRHDDYSPPVVKGMKRAAGKERKRTRVLNDDEIRAVWAAAEGTYGDMVKLALLTGQRLDKIVTMKWADLSDDGVWTIPTETREKGNASGLQLPDDALAIIKARHRFTSNPYVFAASRLRKKDGKRANGHYTGYSNGKASLDKKLKKAKHNLPPWVFHDLRRTAKTLMRRAGVGADISERVLGHAISGVEGIYDQHDYTKEKADALKRLAGLIGKVLNPPKGNVVAMRAAQ